MKIAGTTDVSTQTNWASDFGFKSRHPGGVNVVMGDGGVQFLREDIDHQADQYLGARDDGSVVN